MVKDSKEFASPLSAAHEDTEDKGPHSLLRGFHASELRQNLRRHRYFPHLVSSINKGKLLSTCLSFSFSWGQMLWSWRGSFATAPHLLWEKPLFQVWDPRIVGNCDCRVQEREGKEGREGKVVTEESRCQGRQAVRVHIYSSTCSTTVQGRTWSKRNLKLNPGLKTYYLAS